MPSKKSAYGKMYANYDDRVQGIMNGKRNAHNKLKSAEAVHAQFRHFEDNEKCGPCYALLCGAWCRLPESCRPVSQAVCARGEHALAEEEA